MDSDRGDRNGRRQDLFEGTRRRSDQDFVDGASTSASTFTTTTVKATPRFTMSRGLDEASASSMHDFSSSNKNKDESQGEKEKEERERDAKEKEKDKEHRDKEREREERRERRKEKERRREEKKQKKELSKTSISKSDGAKRSMSGPVVSEELLRAAGVAVNEIGDIPDADGDVDESRRIVSQFQRTTIITETESWSRHEEATENEENEQGSKFENTFEQLMLTPHPLITDLLSREKRRINKKGAFTLADFVSDAELLQLLLEYLTFYDWSLLASVSRVIRVVMVQKKDVREEILERYLSGTIGYQRWSWDEPEPLSLSLQVCFFPPSDG